MIQEKKIQSKQVPQKIRVQVTEVLQRIVEIEANTPSEACETIKKMCENEEIVLDWSDFKSRDFEPYEDD